MLSQQALRIFAPELRKHLVMLKYDKITQAKLKVITIIAWLQFDLQAMSEIKAHTSVF